MDLNSVLSATPALSAGDMAGVRREMIFSCCKWDPQIEDVSVLADFALMLAPGCWRELAASAEALFRETLEAEAGIVASRDLLRTLRLPRAIESALLAGAAEPGDDRSRELRVMRFDFHPTPDGWRISEVNSDVPGGYIEAGGFGAIMARRFGGAAVPASPAEALGAALRRRGVAGDVGLLHATAYSDDRQVMVFLQRTLGRSGITSHLLSPFDVEWAGTTATAKGRPLQALVRFFPGEWLPNLPGGTWRRFFEDTELLQTNPGRAVISQSKRFPLAWPGLRSPLAVWRALLPATRPWQEGLDESWVCKPALGRVGDGVGIQGVTPDSAWKQIVRARRRRPQAWVGQRRFVAAACETPAGPRYPCLGVFVIDGRAAGIYGRLGRHPLIDHLAQEVAVLVPSGAGRN